MKHELKTLPQYFESVLSGEKPFEVRKDDRIPEYSVGDEILLREFNGAEYTGREIKAEVTYILRGEYCKHGYCIMGISNKTRCDKCSVVRESPCKKCQNIISQMCMSECNSYMRYVENKQILSGNYCSNCGRKLKND